MGATVYFSFVYALEQQNTWTAMRRYATLIAHISNGQLPIERYIEAGQRRGRDGLSEGDLESLVHDWLGASINPFSQVFRTIGIPKNLAWGLNAYNESYGRALRTVFEVESSSSNDAIWHATRIHDDKVIYPDICDTAVLAGYERLTKRIAYRANGKNRRKITQISELARLYGLTHTASCHVAEVCENLGYVPLSVIAKEAGCHQRTLQRTLRAEGITAEKIFQGTRLLHATALLRSQKSLTMIAHEVGFFDLAHMDRSFRISTGAPPSFLRRLIRGGIEPETEI